MKSVRTAASLTITALSGLILLVAAFELAALYPHYRAYRLSLADNLAQQAEHAKGTEATADLQLASWLDPQNHLVRLHLAQNQLADGQPEIALQQLAQAGQSREVNRLKIRILLELGRVSEANDAAQQLTNDPAANDSDLVLGCLVASLQGNAPTCSAVNGRVTAPEALQSLSRAQAGNLPLAAELFAVGLPKSSSAILLKLPTTFQRNLLLGQINYQTHTQASLQQAQDFLQEATQLDPSNIAAHQLLAAVYQDLRNPNAAARQTDLVNRLISGRP